MQLHVRVPAFVTALVVCTLLAAPGCSPKVVPSSGPRQPTSADAVKVYPKEPKKYEDLGVVTVPVAADARWDERGHTPAGFQRLKEAAAAKGANGLLLAADKVESDYIVLAGDGTDYYQVPMKREPRAAVAKAIYVLEP